VNLDGFALPVKKLKGTDPIETLDLSSKNLGFSSAVVIASLIGVNGALTVTNLLGNKLDEKSAKMLAEVAKQKGISLCGIRRDQTTADFRNQGLKPPDAILLASDLSQAVVTGALTELSIYGNRVGDKGVIPICEAIQSNKETKLASLNMADNGIENCAAESVAAMLAVTGALTECDLSYNGMGEKGNASIRFAAQGKAGFKLHL